jgi:hypothetical protein
MENSWNMSRLRGLVLPNSPAEVSQYSSYIGKFVLPDFKEMHKRQLRNIRVMGGVRHSLFENTEVAWWTVGLNGNRAMQLQCHWFGVDPNVLDRSDNYALQRTVDLMHECSRVDRCRDVLGKTISINARNPLFTLQYECDSLNADEEQELRQTLAYSETHMGYFVRFATQVYNSNIAILARAYEEMIQPKGIPLWATNWN